MLTVLKKCPTILYAFNLWLKPVLANGASNNAYITSSSSVCICVWVTLVELIKIATTCTSKCGTSRGVARVMNMCTHNARGTDLQSFSETGMEWIFPNSWLLFYGGNHHTRCAYPSGHGGGGGSVGPPLRKI